MKIIDAYWEKRNLGVTCYEIEIDQKDPITSVREEYEALSEREYMVVKIPSVHYEAVRFFQDRGYTFIESAFSMVHHGSVISVPARFEKICSRCSWRLIEDGDIEQINQEIDKGMFKTDRVYLDPAFTNEQAAKRYRLWLRDGIESGHRVFIVAYNGRTIGFTSDIIAGVYDAFQGTGLGLCVQYAYLCAHKNGDNDVYTRVSGNNYPVIQMQQFLGFQIDRMEYVFIKHN